MKVLPHTPDSISTALSVIRDCGIVAHATETCYGLACDISNSDAVAKLFAIKQRPEFLPVSALFASLDQAKEYVEWNDTAQELSQQLPGPLTIILPIAEGKVGMIFPNPPAHQSSVSEGGNPNPNLGIRISSHPLAQELVEKFGSPITTTSANVSSELSTYSVDEILAQFEGQKFQPDLIIDSGELPQNPPSTVIDVSGGDKKTLR